MVRGQQKPVAHPKNRFLHQPGSLSLKGEDCPKIGKYPPLTKGKKGIFLGFFFFGYIIFTL
jgi:hypothetical protein